MSSIKDEVTALTKTPEIVHPLDQPWDCPRRADAEEQTEGVFQHDRKSFAAAIKAAGIHPPQ